MKKYIKILVAMELLAMLAVGLTNLYALSAGIKFEYILYVKFFVLTLVLTPISAFVMPLIAKWIERD